AVPPDRKAVLDRAGRSERVEREAAHRRVATREEPLARRQIFHEVDDRLSIGAQHWLAVRIQARDLARKPRRQAEPRVAGEYDLARVRQRTECLRGEKRLHEADLRADRSRGELAVRARVV